MCTHTWLLAYGRRSRQLRAGGEERFFIFYTERAHLPPLNGGTRCATSVHCALCRVFGVVRSRDEWVIFYATSSFSARRRWCVTARNGRNTFGYVSGADRTVRIVRAGGDRYFRPVFSPDDRSTSNLRPTVLETRRTRAQYECVSVTNRARRGTAFLFPRYQQTRVVLVLPYENVFRLKKTSG